MHELHSSSKAPDYASWMVEHTRDPSESVRGLIFSEFMVGADGADPVRISPGTENGRAVHEQTPRFREFAIGMPRRYLEALRI